MMMNGTFVPAATTRIPMVAVSVYAGATHEIPMMAPPNSPLALPLSPLSGWPVTACWVTVALSRRARSA